jgi:hypothetical protein
MPSLEGIASLYFTSIICILDEQKYFPHKYPAIEFRLLPYRAFYLLPFLLILQIKEYKHARSSIYK